MGHGKKWCPPAMMMVVMRRRWVVWAAFLLAISNTKTTFTNVFAQDIVPRQDITGEETRTGVASYVDASGLGEGTEFYEASSLDLQLLKDDSVFTVRNTFVGAGTCFYGESDDHMVSLSLMRYTPPPASKMIASASRLVNVLTGILHDRRRNVFYEIRQDEQQRQTVRITAEEDIPPTADPISSSSLWKQLTTLDTSTPFVSTMYNRISYFFKGISNTITGITPKQAVYIDAMVLWTESTECYHSSLETGCSLSDTTRANMEAVVDLMIAETNTAMQNSGTGMLIRLTHRQRESSGYVETVGMRNTLGQISQIQFDDLDYVHTLRDTHQADLVQFIVDNRIDPDGLGGVAYLPQINSFGCYDSNAGYSIVCAQCLMNYVSAHEFGHNLGCNHDRGTADACSTSILSGCGGSYVVGSSGTNYGYRSPTSSFRTIMSYQCRSGQCDNNPGGSCPRVPYYSGDAYYPPNGESLGGADNSCRTEIERMKFHVQNYRNC